MSVRWLALIGAAMIVTGAVAREANASDPRVVRVVLLRTDERITLALEMTEEPQKAVLRTLSATVAEVEVGPLMGPVRVGDLAPQSNVPVIRSVSIREYSAAHGTPSRGRDGSVAGRDVFVRARVTLSGPGRGNVRIVGRVVYVDVVPESIPATRVAMFGAE